MNVEQLSSLMTEPEIQKSLLGDYRGPYSLGVGADPEDPSSPALILYVGGENAINVPNHIRVGGETLRVITRTGFTAPKPL